MKQLLLIRHAHAGPHNTDDFARPLTDKGIAEAQNIAGKIKTADVKPQCLLYSPAKRTRKTARIIAEILAIDKQGFDKAIYDASLPTLLKIINGLNEQWDFVTLIGHNPGVSQLILELCDDYRDMPTAAAVLISFDLDEWKLVHSGTGRVQLYLTPN